jgi:hypothetical protein
MQLTVWTRALFPIRKCAQTGAGIRAESCVAFILGVALGRGSRVLRTISGAVVICLIAFFAASVAVQRVGVAAADPASGRTYAVDLLLPQNQTPVVYVRPWLAEFRHGSEIAAAVLFALGLLCFAVGAVKKRP